MLRAEDHSLRTGDAVVDRIVFSTSRIDSLTQNLVRFASADIKQFDPPLQPNDKLPRLLGRQRKSRAAIERETTVTGPVFRS